MSITFQTVSLNARDDHEARLVFVGQRLAAVLVLLSELHGPGAGGWFLEAGFGELQEENPPPFPDLDTAAGWIESHVGGQPATTDAARS